MSIVLECLEGAMTVNKFKLETNPSGRISLRFILIPFTKSMLINTVTNICNILIDESIFSKGALIAI